MSADDSQPTENNHTMHNQNIVPFLFETQPIRTITDEQGEPWFIAADVCAALEISNVTQAVARLDDDEHMQVIDSTTLCSNEGTKINDLLNVVSESGLYSLTLSSRKPEAKKFKKWITSEVLPQIRKTGRYAITLSPAEALHQATALLLEIDRKQRAMEEEQTKTKALVLLAEQKADTANERMDRIETAIDHYTIIGHARAFRNESLPLAEAAHRGKLAASYCKKHGIEMGAVPDPRFGTVKTYPHWVIEEVLAKLAN